MDNKSGISDYLSARFNQPDSPIRDAISIHNHFIMLHNFSMYYGEVIGQKNAAYLGTSILKMRRIRCERSAREHNLSA